MISSFFFFSVRNEPYPVTNITAGNYFQLSKILNYYRFKMFGWGSEITYLIWMR